MPSKKLKRAASPKAPPDPPQQEPRTGQVARRGLSGQGADSVLAHLREEEKARGRKPERS
jgi:hypothetical protein